MNQPIADIAPTSMPESGKIPGITFEEIYLLLRIKENRVYSDEEVALLPEISVGHPHHKEWQIRKQSSERLARFLKHKLSEGYLEHPLRILEIGCGNGWLSHRLSMIPGTKVTGLDINFAELQQAVKVFEKIPNLQFIYGDINKELFRDNYFDVVVFAASIHYFSSFSSIISVASRLLKPGGEIHIFDSHFYKPGSLAAAIKRTEDYFRGVGFPEMAEHYFHHCSSDLKGLNYKVLYSPPLWAGVFPGNSNPFNWICITK